MTETALQGEDGDSNYAAMLAALRDAGVERHDPVRFAYASALASRMRQHKGGAQRIIAAKLHAVLDALKTDHAAAISTCGTAPTLEPVGQRSALGELNRHIAELAHGDSATAAGNLVGTADLKAVRGHRNIWAELSTRQRVRLSIDQAPENAGPLNSHRLVLRSLEIMQTISPAYLTRFMSYVDTLLFLESADRKARPSAKNRARTGP